MDVKPEYDVIVIGAAIAGATLMNILVDAGLRVLVLDKEDGVLEIPRAAHIDDEILRYFGQFDIMDDLADAFQVKGEYNFFDFEDRLFLSMPKARELDQGLISGYYFHQPAFEHFLRDRAVARGVTLLTSHEVTDVVQDADGATVTYRNLASDENSDARSARARYVVACDGSRSPTRKRLGITMEKLARESSHLVVDFTVHDNAVLPDDLGYWTWAKIGREGVTIYVHMPKGVKRLEFPVPPGAAREEVEDLDNVFRLLAPWVTRQDVSKVLRANIYTFYSLVADSWREGRIFLAGDAAHLTPPFLGQGACAAIRDVFNLGWKLARVIGGDAPDALLDTYQSERRPHARELVYRAGKIGEMFKDQAQANPDEVRAIQPREHTIERPLLGHGLHGEAPVPAGRLGPQPRLEDGRLMDAAVQGRFAVVGDPAVIAGISNITRSHLDQLGAITLPDTGDSMRRALQNLNCAAMIVRPDRYLLGIANTAQEIDEIVATAATWLFPHVHASQLSRAGRPAAT